MGLSDERIEMMREALDLIAFTTWGSPRKSLEGMRARIALEIDDSLAIIPLDSIGQWHADRYVEAAVFDFGGLA